MSDPKPLKIELWDIDKVIPFPGNSKKHDLAQVAKIAASIKRWNFDQPIVVDRNGVIIKGHGRRLAAIELGRKKVPVICRADLSDDDANAARLADNRVAISDFDPEMLRIEMAAVNQSLQGIYDDKELEFLEADLGEMNAGAFVTDMDKVVADQKADLEQRTTAAQGAQVPLAKAFGVKSVPATAQLVIGRVMAAAAAAQPTADPAVALVAWLESALPA